MDWANWDHKPASIPARDKPAIASLDGTPILGLCHLWFNNPWIGLLSEASHNDDEKDAALDTPLRIDKKEKKRKKADGIISKVRLQDAYQWRRTAMQNLVSLADTRNKFSTQSWKTKLHSKMLSLWRQCYICHRFAWKASLRMQQNDMVESRRGKTGLHLYRLQTPVSLLNGEGLQPIGREFAWLAKGPG